MRIVLDLTDLVGRGELTKEEADRLSRLAARGTGNAGANILLAFGMVAVALGIGALVPTATTAVIIGGLFLALGLGLTLGKAETWFLLAQILLTIGALVLAGGVMVLTDADKLALFALSAGFAVVSIVSLSGLLAAISVLVLAAALGSSTGYMHAMYMLGVSEPSITIGAFAVVALVLLFASFQLEPRYERLAIIGARTAVLIINVAFLVGSLFGDERLGLPDIAFVVVWALLLLGVGAWGVVANRPWVVNTAAVFGAIHFYTQWFERLGANALTILGGGILLVLFGLALVAFNRRRTGASPTGQGV